MLAVSASVWAATVRLWFANIRCHWVLFGVGLVTALPLSVAGLAVGGVKLPGAANAPFELIGIELPNQSAARDLPTLIGSSQSDQRGCARDQPSAHAGGQGETGSSGNSCAGRRARGSGPPSSFPGGQGTNRGATGYSLGQHHGRGVHGVRAQPGAGRAPAHHHSAAKRQTGHHTIFHGVSDTTDNGDFHKFAKQVGAHPAVLEDFYHWDTPLTTGALKRWHETRTRGVLSLSTAPGDGPELISPREIAQGKDDHYLIRLNRSIAASKQFVYIRLLPEMNGAWNPYCAYRKGGSPRGRKHTTKSFRRAWQRVVLIVRGGKRRTINEELQRRHMPRILRASSNHDPIYKPQGVHRRLPHPRVAFVWTPAIRSSPNVPGNEPGAYWPGKRFVDWVGTDIYSTHAEAIRKLKSFYRHWGNYPFAIGEYSPWNKDRSGRFTHRLFRWAERHNRVRMLVYYRSVRAGSKYDINHWPKALRVLRHELDRRLFAPYAPDLRG